LYKSQIISGLNFDFIQFLLRILNMDPSEIACRIYDTFTEDRPVYDPAVLPQPFLVEIPKTLSLNVKVESRSKSKEDIPVYCDVSMYEKTQNIHRTSPRSLIYDIMERSNPFEFVGNSIFRNHNSIKLANIDAIYKLTGHFATLLKYRLEMTYEIVDVIEDPSRDRPIGIFKEDRDFIFCSVNDPKAAFVDYLQFRVKNGRGYVMNPKDMSKWASNVSTKYLTVTYGEDGTGKLTNNWKFFVNMIRERISDGVQLVVAAGGEDDSVNDLVFLQEALVGIGCCGQGGSFVMKVFDMVTQFSGELLYVLAQCFEAIVMFKPISTRPYDKEKYVICLRRRSDDVVGIYKELLTKVESKYRRSSKVTRFLKNPISEDFAVWLTDANNVALTKQFDALNILDRADRSFIQQKDVDIPIPKYNLTKALKIWALPGNIPHEREFKYV